MNDALTSNARSGSLYSLGVSYLQRGQYTDAERAFAEAARLNPDLAELHGARGAALSHLSRHDEALAAYDRALASNPRQAALWNNRGNALLQLGRHADAVASYDRALAVKPTYTDAWRHRGLALTLLGRLEGALESLNKTIALQPNDPGTLEDKGHLLMRLNRHAEAEATYADVIALKPGSAGLHYNRANALSILTRYDDAIAECGKAFAIDPDYPYTRGVLIHSKLQSCDWRGLDEDKAAIDAALKSGKRAVSPFNYKALSDSPEAERECARIWIANERPANLSPLAVGTRYKHSRIRLAYVSADFNLSAVATAMAGVFEKHDRNRFETFAISFGSNAPTPMRARLRAAFDHFMDVREKTDLEIASTMRDLEIDIAVDLMGYTGECRSWILARRPAPVQINYLGFAGTMAADHIDYILADRMVIPEESTAPYTEKVVYLPDCYLPHDASRTIAEQTPPRSAQGLPDQGFVFASFNNAYKFSPPVFDIWMRLLRGVPQSVLWLPKSHPEAMANLTREAEARGVSARRLIFASPVEAPEDHLARLRLADLFLDTLPYNAHSTAMDALWAGVPVLTSPGNSFQARVAASLLKACDLSEMVVPFAQYEAVALHFSRNPNALSAIREKLTANRNTAPLFDTVRFTRGIEAAFIRMWERHERGEPPESFSVASS